MSKASSREEGFMGRLVWSVPEAAQLLGLSVNHTWKLVHEGQLPSLRLGRRVMIPVKALERHLLEASRPVAAES